MTKKKRTRKVARPTPDRVALIDQAIAKLESSEAPFYDAMLLLKTARAKPVDLPLKYANAMRAINTIAAAPCEREKVTHSTCPVKIEDRILWCWPCYARAVRDGATP